MRIVVLVGLPGSGKSTYLEQLGVNGLSSDAIRKLLVDDETDQTVHVRVFQTLHPTIAGGILAMRDNLEHMAAIEAHGIAPIDMVVVNLYRFEAVAAKAG